MAVMFTWVDWLIVGIIAISSLISLSRGFLQEALSLVIWIAAVIIAWTFGGSLAHIFSEYVATPSVQKILACSVLFLATLIVGGLVTKLLSELVKATGLTGTDRVLGMLFGGARGVVVVVLLVGIVGFAPVEQDPWWQQSQLIPYFREAADWSMDTLMTWLQPVLDQVSLKQKTT
ncbi:CvpA family protein [Zooshikella ganghwensis]|uniref:CvpA family protein n=1 Tax=Zooshikella ganghwensis TaxID=202772 RepID=UPI001F1D0769|nr:CvpA family protein [Zooshikella ganghwensis]